MVKKIVEENFHLIPWFKQAGTEYALDKESLDLSFNQLQSTKQAIDNTKKLQWQNFNLEMRNNLVAYVRKQNAELYEQWNKVAEEIRNNFEEIQPEILAQLKNHNLEESLLQIVRSHFISIVQEMVFLPSHFTGLKYFQTLHQVYKNGKFPCGWEGKIPVNETYDDVNLTSGTLLIW